jgi:hypothetical protein
LLADRGGTRESFAIRKLKQFGEFGERRKQKTVERIPMTMAVHHDNFFQNKVMHNIIFMAE